MGFDAQTDERRLRLGLLITTTLLVGALVVAGLGAAFPRWRMTTPPTSARTGPPSAVRTIEENGSCDGQVDRCLTCHRGDAHGPLDPVRQETREVMARRAAVGVHPVQRFGCSTCHGGVGRALDPRVAHALPGTRARDPLLSGATSAAACGRCHVPGAVAGTERLVQGAYLFLRLGCGMCHSLSGGGRGAWDDGPDLRAIGRRSTEDLQKSLFQPKADFAESTMPSYEPTFGEHPAALEDLMAYVQWLTVRPSVTCAAPTLVGTGLVAAPCTMCHGGRGGAAAGLRPHRCVYIEDRAGELTCRQCHPTTLPESAGAGRDCPVVREHRPACAACHVGSPS